MFSPNRKNLSILLTVMATFYLFALGSYGLLGPDEGRYSEIPREMLESGDFVTPHLNYVAYFEKPALHYWLTASSFALLGQNEFAARLWPALLALAGIALTYRLACDMKGARAGLLSGWILGTSLLYFVIGQINITDMTLSFFMTLSMAGFWFGLRKNKRYFLLFYTGMALATLTKGLIGIILPAGIIFWWVVLTKRWRTIPESLYLPGITLFFLLSLPWFLLVSLRNPDFFYFFFIQEHFLRYTTTIHGRFEPWWWFIPILIVGFIPWTGFLPRAFHSAFSKENRSENNGSAFFLLLWFAVVFLFFSLSGSKLVPYIVPAFPPLAILTGMALDDLTDPKGRKALGRSLAVGTAIMLPFALALAAYPFVDDKYGIALLPYAAPVSAVLLALIGTSWYFYAKGRPKKVIAVFCIFALVHIGGWKHSFRLYDDLLSSRDLVEVLAAHIHPEDVIAQFKEYDQGLSFYLERRIVLVEYMGELAFGALREDNAEWFLDLEDFMGRYWQSPERVLLILRKDHVVDFEKMNGHPLTVLAETPKRLVVTNRESEAEE
ncbi:MAG: phospholipid carrier-dependent glycosyltransferase [Thermovirgaceae bacterium]